MKKPSVGAPSDPNRDSSRTSEKKMPFWQTRPCPAWCRGCHRDDEGGEDRRCSSKWEGKVTLKTMDADVYTSPGRETLVEPVQLTVYLARDFREFEPRVVVERGGKNQDAEFSLAEARRMVDKLTKAIQIATQS